MVLAPLTTVPDEGGADAVRGALADAGIEAQVSRLEADHPYQPQVLPRWLIAVPASQLVEAQRALEHLAREVADEVEAQAGGAGALNGDTSAPAASAPATSLDGLRRSRYAHLALAFVAPFPAACFYARRPRLGALFFGIFLAAMGATFWFDGLWGFSLVGGPHAVLSLEDREAQRQAAEERQGRGRQRHRPPSDDEEGARRRIFLATLTFLLIGTKLTDLVVAAVELSGTAGVAKGVAPAPSAGDRLAARE